MENTYHCYANRELSWLRFNERVLEEAEDSRLPLCERLSFLSIFQSNLDEFFMVRIGSLQDQMLLDKNARENKTNMTSGEQIDAALAFIHKLTARRDAAYNGLLEQLAEQGIRLLDFAHMEEESRTELEKLFRQDYLPLLSSFIISKKQAFPFLKNKGIYAVAVLSTKAEKKKIGIVPCGNEIFPRLVPVPGRTGCFILSEELILHFLPLLYKGYKVTSKTLARITRNADIDADLIYDEDLNYRDHMAEVVKKRKKLAPVRLELSREIDEEIIQSLCKNLKLDPKRVFEYDSPLDHSFLFQIEDQLRSHTDLFFAPRHPQPSPALDERKPIIPQILEEDKLIHYPYESIRPFLQLLHEAACDPDVVSMVLGMAGNVGTQSLAVTIRVLVDENLTVSKKFQLLWKEVRVGLLNGTILAVMALSFLGCYIHFFKGYAWNTALLLSGCVGASLVVAMVVSSLVGTLVPMLFHKIHIDPAVASGPLITTINDLVAVVVYYGLAMVVLIDLFHLA